MCGFLVSVDETTVHEKFEQAFAAIAHRGPDMDRIQRSGNAWFGFHRLSIMDTSDSGMQPFHRGSRMLVCNGEIYNFEALKSRVSTTYQSSSDCEVLLPLYETFATSMFAMLDAEYALVIYDEEKEQVIAARDQIGIRPLFYGKSATGIGFASEAKALIGLYDEVMPFPPGHYYVNGEFVDYRTIYGSKPMITDEAAALATIHDNLIAAVEKRLMSDVRVGFLLSGGLDSSLVCAIAAQRSKTPIDTFAIGMAHDAIDLKYARQVAEKIGSNHHEVIMDDDDVIQALKPVISMLETWDITTIRASIGMYMLCRYIHEKTDIKVLLTGEISDELFGYKYTDFAPSAQAFQDESLKRLRELYMYDVLRADRCVAAWSLEARVPFGDLTFVEDVLRIDPALKMNRHGIGKYLLRQAFADDDLLPESILWREKAAFSDAVGHSMVDILKDYAREQNVEVSEKLSYHCRPISAESALYRCCFEADYQGYAAWIADYWMPNKTWPNCNVDDPSARVLSNYGLSGV